MTESYYLVDNNVLSKIKAQGRASRFFRERCRITDEVLYEAREFPDIDMLETLRHPTSVTTLDVVREVMATVSPGDRKLVDLYRNLGGADPFLIAAALELTRKSQDSLFEEHWQIATDDKAVQDKAAEFRVYSVGTRDFTLLLK